MKNKKLLIAFSGIGIGFLNGLLGAGGGMIAVPILKHLSLSQKEAHANAVAVILPITILSAILYLINGYVTLKESLIYIPTGIIGSLIGAALLKKISPLWLKRIFSFFMLYAGVRLLFKWIF